MAKFFGNVGYVTTEETSPGIFSPVETIKQYYGDDVKIGFRWNEGQKANADYSVDNKISIVADGFAYQNIGVLKWVEWMGSRWKVTSFEIAQPRIILTLGEVYNG